MRGIGGLDAGYGKLDKGWIDLSLHRHLTYRLGMDQAEFVRKLSLLKCKKPAIVTICRLLYFLIPFERRARELYPSLKSRFNMVS